MIFHIQNEKVRQNCIQYISDMPLEKFDVTISDRKRTRPQNRYYWVIVGIISKDIGYSIGGLHESFKREFIGSDQGKDIFGNLYLKAKSSAQLKKLEFIEYIKKVQAFADSQGIKIPAPDYCGLTIRE
jgi:hypothetical protein